MVQLSDPGLPGSLDQLVFDLLEGSGLTIVVAGPWDLKDTVDEVSRVSAFFAGSEPLDNGLAARGAHNSLWAGLDGPAGSAVLLFGAPGDGRMIRITMEEVRTVDPRWRTDVVFRGELDPTVAQYMEAATAVPARDFLPAATSG